MSPNSPTLPYRRILTERGALKWWNMDIEQRSPDVEMRWNRRRLVEGEAFVDDELVLDLGQQVGLPPARA